MRLLLALFLFSFSCTAFSAVSFTPLRVRNVFGAAANDAHYAEVAVKTTSGTFGNVYSIRQVAVSAASMGSLAMTAFSGPWGAALTAALLLKDWYYNPSTRTVNSPVDVSCPSDHDCSAVKSWFSNASACAGRFFPDLSSAVNCGVSAFPSGLTFDRLEFLGDPVQQVYLYGCNSDGSCVYSPNSVFPSTSLSNAQSSPFPGRQITDGEIGQQVFDAASSDPQYRDLPTDIADDAVQRGVAESAWPELAADAATETQKLTNADAGQDVFTDAEKAVFRSPEDLPFVAVGGNSQLQ
jgi:hypothetical protein